MDWNEELKCWTCECGGICPNWTPHDVKFPERTKSNLEVILDNPISFFFCCLGVMMIILAVCMLLEALFF